MKMRRIAAGLAVAVVLIVAIGLAVVPGIVDRGMNKVVGGPWPVSARAEALHASLYVADMHGDTLLWQRDLDRAADRGHIDLPRLEAGHVALQIFSSVTKTPKGQNYEANGGDTDNITLMAMVQLQPVRTWGSLLERSLWHAEKLRRAVAREPARLRRVLTARDLTGQGVGAMLSVEGAQNLEGRLANLDRLYDAGFRMIGLAHFFDNEVAGSMHGLRKGGLTPFGLQVVRAMEAKSMIVDLAHCSHACFADVMRVAARPVVVSHGGVIGIGYWDAAVCAPTPAATARAIIYAAKVAGIDHVGLGSDFDGAVTTGFDTAHLDAVTQALLDAGLGDAAIAKVMGGNVRRLLAAGLPA